MSQTSAKEGAAGTHAICPDPGASSDSGLHLVVLHVLKHLDADDAVERRRGRVEFDDIRRDDLRQTSRSNSTS